MRRLLAFVSIVTAVSAASAEEELATRVERALVWGAHDLLTRQAADGSFQKEDPVHPLGRTALATFALLHAGVPADDEAVRRALAFLGVSRGYASGLVPHSTYEASCLVMLLGALGPGYEKDIQAICAWLEDHFDGGVGLWGYPDGARDLSNTQFATMALKVGERHGYRADDKLWKKLLDTLPRLQAERGGFRYKPDDLYRATMTHAALLILDWARESLGLKRLPREARACIGPANRYLEETFSVERVGWGRGFSYGSYYYYMYGLERFAVHFGLERVAGRDWYAEGAEALLRRQGENGSWGAIEDTSFAILFLRRALFAPPVTTGVRPDVRDPQVPKPPAKAPEARPRADVPFLGRWLVAGPFRHPPGEDDMLFEQHVDLKRARLAAGARAGSRRFVEVEAESGRVVLREEGPGTTPPWSCWYAGLWLHATEPTEAWLWVGSDDGFRLYLDGEEAYLAHHHDPSGDDRYRIPLSLAPGAHALVLQVENLLYDCNFTARLTDAEGAPLPAVRASLTRATPR